MKTRVIEIELAGPDVNDEAVNRIIDLVNNFIKDDFLDRQDNIAVEVREKNTGTILHPPQYPLPINPNWEKPDNIPNWWTTQPTCSVTAEGESK